MPASNDFEKWFVDRKGMAPAQDAIRRAKRRKNAKGQYVPRELPPVSDEQKSKQVHQITLMRMLMANAAKFARGK